MTFFHEIFRHTILCLFFHKITLYSILCLFYDRWWCFWTYFTWIWKFSILWLFKRIFLWHTVLWLSMTLFYNILYYDFVTFLWHTILWLLITWSIPAYNLNFVLPGQMTARLMHLHLCAFKLIQLLPDGSLKNTHRDTYSHPYTDCLIPLSVKHSLDLLCDYVNYYVNLIGSC